MGNVHNYMGLGQKCRTMASILRRASTVLFLLHHLNKFCYGTRLSFGIFFICSSI